MTCDYEDADHCNVHGHHEIHEQGDKDINIGLISGCLYKFKKNKMKVIIVIHVDLKDESNVQVYVRFNIACMRLQVLTLLRILPDGVVSKNDIGACKML